MGLLTNGPFGQKLDGIGEAYRKIHERTLEKAAAIKPEDATVQESTFADKFRAKRNYEKKVERDSDSPKTKQKLADRKDPAHREKVKNARKKWLEHVQFFHKKELVESPVTPVLATKLRGTKYDALKPQSEVGKKKLTTGTSSIKTEEKLDEISYRTADRNRVGQLYKKAVEEKKAKNKKAADDKKSSKKE